MSILIENVSKNMQLKRLTHPRLANLREQTNNATLQEIKDPHDKGQYYAFYLDNAKRAIDLMIQKHRQTQNENNQILQNQILKEIDLKPDN